MSRSPLGRRPNLVLLITDQESGAPHWPAGWAEANLPAMRRLRDHGLTFTQSFTNSCTCTPARATLFTGLYPAQHGAIEVLEFDNSGRPDPVPDGATSGQVVQASTQLVKERRQRGVSAELQNLAKILRTAGYHVVYKGKWHLTKPVQYSLSLDQKYWTEADARHLEERWGFAGWGMPDAGDNLKIANMGGGRTNNDGRFVDGSGQAAKYGRTIPRDVLERQSAVRFLDTYDGEAPFCLIVSLVNPHDVLAYPGTDGALVTLPDGATLPLYQAAGYHDRDFRDLPIEPPATAGESLATKPRAQAEFRTLANQGNGAIDDGDDEKLQRYCQFYAFLAREVDGQLLKVLDALDRRGDAEETVVLRLADHGDMAMAHGRQRQKMYNVYQETIHVPFVVSSPRLFPRAETTGALASLIDVLPTLATLAGVPDRDRWSFKGHDLTPVLEDPRREVQDFVHFTYEDLYFYVPAPNHLRCLVEKDWKYAVYYDPAAGKDPEYEMYDRGNDPDETRNLGHPGTPVAPEIEAERSRLHAKLLRVMDELGTTPDEIVFPRDYGDHALVATPLPERPAG